MTATVPVEVLLQGLDDRLVSGKTVNVKLMKRRWISQLQAGDFSEGAAKYVTETIDEAVSEQPLVSGFERQGQDGQQGQALQLRHQRDILDPGGLFFLLAGHDILPQKIIEAGDDHPQQKGEHDGKGEGHKQILFPGKGQRVSGLDP